MADPAYIVDGVLTDGEAWVALGTAAPDGSTNPITFASTDDGQVGDFSQYLDLVLVLYCRDVVASTDHVNTGLRYNGDAGSNYVFQRFYGDGATATATNSSGSVGYCMIFPANTATANAFGSAVVHIFDINSGKYKSCIGQYAADRDGGGYVGMDAMTWKSQAAITSVGVNAGNYFAAGSRIDLFDVLPRMVA